MAETSEKIQRYFEQISAKCKKEFDLASEARKKGHDPSEQVEVQLAANMAERVVGLISVVAPQIRGSGVVERIIDLEKKYGKLDWRVALQIALEVAQEKYCKFKDKKEAMEVGIRVGFAYGTVGVVSGPLEGLVNIDIKKRLDGKGEYFCLNYAGPIRNAGGTAASWSVIIADYVRKNMGYAKYDPTEDEIKRCATEIEDYHEWVANLQYFPSKKETEFMAKNLPVEISGDPSEDKEVSNYKDLPRVPVNKIRSGYCLMHSACLPLKGEKLWKELSKWGKEMGMEQWNFLEEFIKIKKEAHAGGNKNKESNSENKNEKSKITPDYTYIKDLVAGRPVMGHPLRSGGLRLRYGRGRMSGYSAQSVHPATMHVTNDFIATGTQLKVERPGKGAVFTPCDTIDGPTVKLKDGSVAYLETEQQAKDVKKQIAEVLYLGDALINYGDFLDRAHVLTTPGYCEEWWSQELEKNIVGMFGNLDEHKLSELIEYPAQKIARILKNPLKFRPNAEVAIRIAKETKTPLHPRWTCYWDQLEKKNLMEFIEWIRNLQIETGSEGIKKGVLLIKPNLKRILEIIGAPHQVTANEYVVLDKNWTTIFKELFMIGNEKFDDTEWEKQVVSDENKNTLDILNKMCIVKQRDKAGIFIGSRMGRPEKAKMRKLTGSPHGLFPVGEEGGRMRCFQSAIEAGKVTAEVAKFKCKKCDEETVFSNCLNCGEKTTRLYFCSTCGAIETPTCEKHGEIKPCSRETIPIEKHFREVLKKLKIPNPPELIKGVRGTNNKEHIPEHLAKAVLRAKHTITVNKDGTTRYDASELPITHFKVKEIRTTIEKIKELGYEKDIHGKEIVDENQVIEIYPQDIILPCCPDSPDEGADKVMKKVCDFIDELLVKLYGMKPYYDLKTPDDLVGHLVVGLAPHTSAGALCRIIGFSKTQGFLGHPLIHAAMRRDCDGDETCLFMLMDAFLNFSRKYLPESRGSTMDAPLVLTSTLNASEVDDMVFRVDRAWKYPLEFYEACQEQKMPWDVKVEVINNVLGKPEQYEGMGFTHDTDDINSGITCSAYKTLPSMQEKLVSQMNLAGKLRAVDETDVARLVIEKHFIRDIKGNLRKFSMQKFRCVACNEKYRRPPLVGKCTKCGGKIIFTISEGGIVKYLGPSLSLAEKYDLPTYLKQTLELTKRRIEGVFGKEDDKQSGLGSWF